MIWLFFKKLEKQEKYTNNGFLWNEKRNETPEIAEIVISNILL